MPGCGVDMSKHSAHDRRWTKLRAQKLAADPWCEVPATTYPTTCGMAAVTVDHIEPQSQRPDLKYVWSNLRSMCGTCHMVRHGKRPRAKVDASTGLPTANHWWAER
jgi:5-methylcytosine-specific restriction protein A